MAYKRGERDHRDMLAHQDPKAKASEPVYYPKPDWMVEAPVARSNVEMPPLPPYLTHGEPSPSLEAYTAKPAPFSEDGFSAFRRDGDYGSSYKMESLAERSKPGQKRNAGPRQGFGQVETTPSRDEDALWNFARRTPIKAPAGDLETEFRSQPGNLTYTDMESYTPTTTPPIRSAGSDRTPAKSVYQEQCDQIWSHHRRPPVSHASAQGSSPAGRATSNAKYNMFTGAKESGDGDRAGMNKLLRNERERQREMEDANQHPPWATHDGEDGSVPLKNG